MSALQILHRDPGSRARAGRPAHRPRRGPHAGLRPAGHEGDRQGPAAARGRRARLRHGPRQHVPPVPRARRTSSSRASAACTTSWAGGGRSSPTPAAFRSSRWATARSPTRSRGARRSAPTGRAACWRSRRRACASAPTSTARSGSWRPRRRWRSRPRSAPTSRWSSTSARRSTSTATTPRARPSARTAGWTAAWTGTTSTARPGSSSTGSSRAASTRTCASSRPRRSPPRPVDGIAIGGSLGADKPQMYEVVGWTTAVLAEDPRPRHLLGIGDIDDLIRGVELGIDTFDCAMPTRLGRHGVALVPDPEQRWRVDLTAARFREDDGADHGGLPVPGLRGGLLARLPALPRQEPRADRRAAADAAQPRVRRAAHGAPARRDRRGARWPRTRPRCAAARRPERAPYAVRAAPRVGHCDRASRTGRIRSASQTTLAGRPAPADAAAQSRGRWKDRVIAPRCVGERRRAATARTRRRRVASAAAAFLARRRRRTAASKTRTDRHASAAALSYGAYGAGRADANSARGRPPRRLRARRRHRPRLDPRRRRRGEPAASTRRSRLTPGCARNGDSPDHDAGSTAHDRRVLARRRRPRRTYTWRSRPMTTRPSTRVTAPRRRRRPRPLPPARAPVHGRDDYAASVLDRDGEHDRDRRTAGSARDDGQADRFIAATCGRRPGRRPRSAARLRGRSRSARSPCRGATARAAATACCPRSAS